jgi:hypothetical protein
MIKKQILITFFILLLGNFFHFFVWFDYAGLSYNNPIKKGTDADQYIQGTESLLSKGELSYFRAVEYPFHSNFIDENTDDRSFYYAFRTPGFNFIHYPLRLFLDYNDAIVVFLIIQVILSALAKLLLSHYLAGISEKYSLTFWVLITLFILDISLSFLNTLPLTESLGLSFLMISFHFLFNTNRNNINLVLSGLFFIVSVFFRPFLIVVLLLYIPYLIINLVKEKSIKKITFFLFPILFISGIWTIRNYIKTDRVIFLATTMEWVNYTNKAYIANQDICFQVGLSHEFWSKESPLYWLTNKNDTRSPKEVYPKEFCANENVVSSLNLAKKLFLMSEDKKIELKKRKEYELKSEKTLRNLSKNAKEVNTISYQINNRIKVTKAQFNPEPMKPFISLKYPLNWLTIILELFISKLTFYLGFLVAVFYFFKHIKNWNGIFTLSAIALGTYFLFVVVLLNHEKRELFITNFLFSILAMYFLTNLVISKKWVSLSLILTILTSISILHSFNYMKF